MRHLVIALLMVLAGTALAQPTLTPIASYETGVFDEGATEIAAFDPATARVFSVNGDTGAVDVLDLSDPVNPTYLFSIDLSPWGAGANSVDVHDGLVAAAVEAEDKQADGQIVLFAAGGSCDFAGAYPCGALPDMLMFTPDGQYILCCNEGEPNDDYDVDPEGSLTIVNLAVPTLSATTVTFEGWNDDIDALRAAGVRIYGPGASVAQDLEPEYVAYNPATGIAYVSCQENNALVTVDVAAATALDIIPLGFKDHSLPGNGLDASDRDDVINITSWPVLGMYQPDAIAGYTTGGNFYVITANEGDSRDYDGYSEEDRIKDLDLDPVAFPDAATLQADENLGRLGTTLANGDTDGDGDYDVLYANGARSFSIWNAAGQLVYDSGDELEQTIAALFPADFNSTNDENGSFDSRSDAKGPEPEGVALMELDGSWYALIGMERMGGIFLYDVTDPTAPFFVEYTTTRDFSGDAEAGTAGGLGPEGICLISAEDSPIGQPLALVSNEVSGSIDILLVDYQTVGNQPVEDEVEVTALPAASAIRNIYPNPFNPTTTVDFALARAGQVELQILDIRGRLVQTLVSGVREAGEHRVTWQAGTETASGTYFARLVTGERVQVRRMQLVK